MHSSFSLWLVGGLLLCSAAFGADTTTSNGNNIEHPDGTGWHIARPSGAHFTALLPCPYSDVTVQGGAPMIASRMTACRQRDAMWTASEMEYATPEVASSWFAKVAAQPGAHELKQASVGNGRRTLELSSSAVNLVGLTRATLDGKRIIILVAEWRPSQAEGAKENMPKFFGSLKLVD